MNREKNIVQSIVYHLAHRYKEAQKGLLELEMN